MTRIGVCYAVVLILSVVLCAVVLICVFHNAVRTSLTYSAYANAIRDHFDRRIPLPSDLFQLERSYNEVGSRIAVLPPESGYQRPQYRPPAEARGRYLLIVSPSDDRWFSWYRVLIYANSDGGAVEVRLVLPAEVAKSVAEDDDNRRRQGHK